MWRVQAYLQYVIKFDRKAKQLKKIGRNLGDIRETLLQYF